eukprot:GHVN01037622.1.p1 GENE.GHVN01037622.1~~GHVN01037622.1.p1  ORF type:complete len:245 (+),score=45.75 GHVN01037622.1:209-943(+)
MEIILQHSNLPCSRDLTYELFFDGSCINNPGPMSCGFVLRHHRPHPHSDGPCRVGPSGGGEVICRESRVLGKGTNNQAEYFGLIMGLRYLLDNMSQVNYHLFIIGDSQLVIRHMTGEYNVESPRLRIYHTVARGLVREITERTGGWVEYVEVRRDQNREADEMARRGLSNGAGRGDFFFLIRMAMIKQRLRLTDTRYKEFTKACHLTHLTHLVHLTHLTHLHRSLSSTHQLSRGYWVIGPWRVP